MRRGADDVGGSGAGLECAVVEDRFDDDEATQPLRSRRVARHQLAPRESGLSVGKESLERSGDPRQRLGELVELDAAGFHPRRNEGQRVREAAQGRIGRQRGKERLRPDELLRGLGDLFGREEQQAVVLEEGAGIGLAHRLDVLPLLRERPAPGCARHC